jgi:hypothetical protein
MRARAGSWRSISDAFDRALDEDVVRERIAQLGGSIAPKDERSPATFDRWLKASPRHEIADHHHRYGKRQGYAEHGAGNRQQSMAVQPSL